MVLEMANPIPGQLSVIEAAARLRVHPNDVRRLIDAGDLPAVKVGRQWLIPESAVERRLDLAPRPGRRMSPRAAWGILLLAEGGVAAWLTPQERWRARRRLGQTPLQDMRDRLVTRGVPYPCRAHPSMLPRMRDDAELVLTGVTAARALGVGLLGGDDRLEAYVDSRLAASVIDRYRLRPSSDPNVQLRIVKGIDWPWPPARIAPRAAVALDLAEDPEPRVREVGLGHLRTLRQ